MSDPYTITITGSRGPVLSMVMDATTRHVTSLSLDDSVPHELLIITAVLGGHVEGTLARLFRDQPHLRPLAP